MKGQAGASGAGPDFRALVVQCLARVRVWGHGDVGNPEGLAERVALIVSDNWRRGRIPQHEAPHPHTRVPDGYIDEVLFFVEKEGAVLRALRSGEEAAWVRVLELMRVRAYSYLLRGGVETGQARQLAHDFAQSTAVTLWEQALERFPYDTHFDAWVSRIVAYEVSQWRRSTKEQREQRALSLDGGLDSGVGQTLHDLLPDLGAGRALDAAEARILLREALRELTSDDQREAVLRQLAGQGDEEIARALGRSRQAIYNLRHRALRALRRILGAGRDPDEENRS